MKICIFYPSNVLAGWMAIGGYINAFKRLGHDVLHVILPGNCYAKGLRKPEEVAFYPSFEEINKCEVVILAYLEHIFGWLDTLYGLEEWKKQVKIPVIARFDESFDRYDLGLPGRWPIFKQYAQFYSFPAIQDAEKYDGQFLPYGADTMMFAPRKKESNIIELPKVGITKEITEASMSRSLIEHNEKDFGVGFIGTMYKKRADYIMRLLPFLQERGIPFHHGPVLINDLHGQRFELQTLLLAENYAAMKIFFCPPPLSNLIVNKIVEVMACGTFVMYPLLKGAAEKNLSIFEDKQEIVYYDADNFEETADIVSFYLEEDVKREVIAKVGMKKVHSQYTLDNMLTELLQPVERRVLAHA